MKNLGIILLVVGGGVVLLLLLKKSSNTSNTNTLLSSLFGNNAQGASNLANSVSSLGSTIGDFFDGGSANNSLNQGVNTETDISTTLGTLL